MGMGRYSDKLSYKDWYDFNNSQRAHYNFLEMSPSIFSLLPIAGLYFPIPAAALGLVLAISRLIYVIGYTTVGPEGRLIGSLGNHLSILALFVIAMISGIKFITGSNF